MSAPVPRARARRRAAVESPAPLRLPPAAKAECAGRLFRFALRKSVRGEGLSDPYGVFAGDRAPLSREIPTNSRGWGLQV